VKRIESPAAIVREEGLNVPELSTETLYVCPDEVVPPVVPPPVVPPEVVL
jgi:hypothetical protein